MTKYPRNPTHFPLWAIGVSAGALLFSIAPASAQLGDPKAAPRDNPSGHVVSPPDEKSRDNNDSARDYDTSDTVSTPTHTANENLREGTNGGGTAVDTDSREGAARSKTSRVITNKVPRDSAASGTATRDRRNAPRDQEPVDNNDLTNRDRTRLRDSVRETAGDARATADAAVRRARATAGAAIRGARQEVRDVVNATQANFDVATTRSADVGVWFDRSATDGLLVSDVSSTSPLAKAGLREGDTITAVNGNNVATEQDFTRNLLSDEVRNERIPIAVERHGVRQMIYIRPTMIVDHYSTLHRDPMEQVGIVPDDRYGDRVVVWRVVPRSPAYYAGVQPGDVITAWSDTPIGHFEDLTQAVQDSKAGEVAVSVRRGRQTRTLQMDLPQIQTSAVQSTSYRVDPTAEVNAAVGAAAVGAESDITDPVVAPVLPRTVNTPRDLPPAVRRAVPRPSLQPRR